MDKLKYSIIYAVIRPEIAERLSLGLIFVNEDKVKIRYSQKKLRVLKDLYSENEYKFIAKVMRSLNNELITSVDTINYLARYSNNLIAISKLQSIDLAPSSKNEDWLFRNYVYAGVKKVEN